MDTDGAARQVRSLKMENRVCNAYNNFFDNDGGGPLAHHNGWCACKCRRDFDRAWGLSPSTCIKVCIQGATCRPAAPETAPDPALVRPSSSDLVLSFRHQGSVSQ
jgi:hypothetical protein